MVSKKDTEKSKEKKDNKTKEKKHTTKEVKKTDDIEKSDDNQVVQELKETIHKLERKLEEQQIIAKRAQSDYFQLKMDMDSLVSRTTKQQSTANIDSLMNVGKKIFPMITQLKQTVDGLSDEVKETQWGSGVVLVFNKIMKSLESLQIYPIEVDQGTDPDINKHIPISTEPVKDKKLQGKILKQIEQGYYYNDGTTEKVIIPAKVIVGV